MTPVSEGGMTPRLAVGVVVLITGPFVEMLGWKKLLESGDALAGTLKEP